MQKYEESIIYTHVTESQPPQQPLVPRPTYHVICEVVFFCFHMHCALNRFIESVTI